MRNERNNGLAGQVIGFKKSEERHRQGTKPVWGTNKDYIVIGQVIDSTDEYRSIARIQLTPAPFSRCVEVLGIRVNGFQFKNIGACKRLNLFSYIPRIATPRIIDN